MTPSDAKRLIQEHQTEAPVQTVAIANALGLEVFKVSTFPDNLSGMIKREGDKYVIYVNSKHSVNRRRFTIAHEIAHFVLHRDKIGDGLVDDAMYRSGLSSHEETEANRLAADILMPWHLLRDVNLRESSISDLASKFQVSEAAMGIRIGIPEGAIAAY